MTDDECRDFAARQIVKIDQDQRMNSFVKKAILHKLHKINNSRPPLCPKNISLYGGMAVWVSGQWDYGNRLLAVLKYKHPITYIDDIQCIYEVSK